MATLECLIVDDDESKVGKIREIVVNEMGMDNAVVEVVASANEATAMLRSRRFDLLIVDVNLPIRKGDIPNKDGGVRLLRQVGRGTSGLICPPFVIGITGYEDLAATSGIEFESRGWTLIRYSPDSTSWEETLLNQCRHISN